MKNALEWQSLIEHEKTKSYYQKLMDFLDHEYHSGKLIYPSKNDWFKALELCPLNAVKVVILGQDPYHNPNQAMGLSFSVKQGCELPPSLKNIYKELVDDIGVTYPTHGNLESWAKQGVLLLNTVLTVEAQKANSHQSAGWLEFTQALLSHLVSHREHIVFILWGAQAKKAVLSLDLSQHYCLYSAHPSPLSSYRGFFGSKPFSKTNEYLIKHQIAPIDWRI